MHYYTCDISTAILDLDLDLCENFLFFVTMSILHIHTCMIQLKKAVLKGFISFLHLRASNNLWRRYDPKTEESRRFPCNRVISLRRIMYNASVESSHQGLHFIFLHLRLLKNLWGRYDPKTKKKQTFFLVT